MLDPRWRKVARDVWLHKARMLLVVPAIAVGLIAAGSVLNTAALVERATRRDFAASNPAAATIRTDSIDASLLALVRAHPAVAEVQARRTVGAGFRTLSAGSRAVLFVSDDFAAQRIGLVKAEAGVWPPADGTVVVERSSVDFSGVGVGDPVTVALGGGPPITLEVSGIARDVGLAPGWMERVVYGFVTPGTLARLGGPASLNQLQLTVRDRALDQDAVRRIAYEVAALVEGTGRTVTDVDVPVPGEHIHSGQMNSFLYTQGAFGVLALVLSGFLVVNLITAMLLGQVREIGVMKAIGARPAQLGGMYLALAVALGVAATAVALPVSIAIGRRYGAFKAELLNFEVAGHAIPAWAIVLQGIVGLLVPVLAAAIPVTRGCRISVAAALREVGLTASGRPGAGLASRVSGLGRPILLSLRNAFRQRQRMALTMVTLAAGGAVFLGATNLRRAIRESVGQAFAPLRYDFVVRLARPASPDRIEALIAGVPGVAAVEAWTGTSAAVVKADGTRGNGFAVAAPPFGTRLFDPPLAAGRWPRPEDGRALVLSEQLLADEGLAVGDEASVAIGETTARWRIVGAAARGVPLATGFAGREMVADLAGGGATSAVVAGTGGPASQLGLIQQVRAELARAGLEVAGTTLLAEARRVREDHLLMAGNFLGAMAWVVIAVGGLALASTMSLAVLERTREIGVLRAIGARHRSILAIVLVEGLVIGTLSWLVALPLSAPMSLVLGAGFGRRMFPLPPMWLPDPWAAAAWLGLVLVVSVVATAGPALRATRVPTATALAYE